MCLLRMLALDAWQYDGYTLQRGDGESEGMIERVGGLAWKYALATTSV